MKQYKVRNSECTYNLGLCDMLQSSMARECFMAERVCSFGSFVFEYNDKARDYRFFSYIASGYLCRKKLSALLYELRLVYNLRETVRINSRLVVYRFEPVSIKGKLFLDDLAKSHGLTEFSHDSYIAAIRRERDRILCDDYRKLTIIFGIVTLLFAAGIFVLWYAAIPCAVAFMLFIMNLVRYRSVAAYTK